MERGRLREKRIHLDREVEEEEDTEEEVKHRSVRMGPHRSQRGPDRFVFRRQRVFDVIPSALSLKHRKPQWSGGRGEMYYSIVCGKHLAEEDFEELMEIHGAGFGETTKYEHYFVVFPTVRRGGDGIPQNEYMDDMQEEITTDIATQRRRPFFSPYATRHADNPRGYAVVTHFTLPPKRRVGLITLTDFRVTDQLIARSVHA